MNTSLDLTVLLLDPLLNFILLPFIIHKMMARALQVVCGPKICSKLSLKRTG